MKFPFGTMLAFYHAVSGNPMSDDFRKVYPGLRELTTRYAPTATANRLEIYDLEILVPVAPGI